MSTRRLGAVPIVLVIVVMLVAIVGLAASAPAPRPSPSLDVALDVPPTGTARPAATPLGRYPISGEATVVGNCVSGIDPNTVPAVIAQAFCVCTLNQYEQLYPAYDDFQRAAASGAISEQIKSEISNRCARAVVGG